MSLETTLWFSGTVAEAVLVGLLVFRRTWRSLPFFCAYMAWTLISDCGNYVVLHYFSDSYTKIYLVETIADSALQLCLLVELAWSVLRPSRASLPRGARLAVAGLTFAVGAAIWPFATIPGLAAFPPELYLLVRLQQTVSIFRILLFLLLAGCSQLLSIGWRNRELQVVTGLGLYSLVSIAIAIMQTHQTMGTQYGDLNRIVAVSYFCSLLYWVVCFAQKEAARREFTPQMQNLLLAVAGTAKATRVALVDTAAAKARKPGE